MNILYISYWSINEGLSRSTVIPNVRILASFDTVNKIYLATIERKVECPIETIDPKIIHIPMYSRTYPLPLLDKWFNFYKIPRILHRLIITNSITKILARGAPAGSIAYFLWQRTRIPFFVESFEPHADYMAQTGTWKKWDIRYLLQKRWEKKQIRHAQGLMPVAEKYRSLLLDIGIPDRKTFTVPCAVNVQEFRFDPEMRNKIRNKLGIKNQVVGIYVGKFGGLYLDEEAFKIIHKCYEMFPHFYMIILSPMDPDFIKQEMDSYNIPESGYHSEHAAFSKIPDYLSASDFGLALYKSFPANTFLSPVKIGEYWANGLPVLLTHGVGDENSFIEKEEGGALFDPGDPTPGIMKIKSILQKNKHRSEIPALAIEHRSFERVHESYQQFLMG